MSKVETDTRPVRDAPAAPVAPRTDVGALRRGPLARLTASGFARIAGISASLVGTQALTSVLGLVFWTLAARTFSIADVGVAGAAVALMMLLASLGSFGLGTLLIARLPLTAPDERRVLVRTCVAAAAAGGAVLGLVVPAALVHLFGVAGLAPVAGGFWPLLGLAVGTGLTSAVMVLDQAVLTVGVGMLQFERNVTASGVKIVALLALALAGAQGGMIVFLAWTIGTAVSLPLVAWRTRSGGAPARDRGLVEPVLLRGIGRSALSHHALNVSIQAALQLLPVIVTVLVSAEQNARFSAAIMVAGFVFALPYAVSVGLFAAARGDESEVLSRMRLTIPFGLAISAAADLVLFPLAEPVLRIFGDQYADGAVLLRLIVLAGLPFVVKDHFIALRRVQGRTTQALAVTAVFLVLELVAAGVGAHLGGAVGLCIGWLAVLTVEALVLAVPLVTAARQRVATERPAPRIAPATVPTALASASPARPTPVRPATTRRRSRDLTGPTLLIAAFGVVLMGVAAAAARTGATGAPLQVLWLVGLAVVFVPPALRIIGPRTTAAEQVALAIGLAVVLQLSRLVVNPTAFAFHDELIHADTLRLIDDSGRLFSFNPLLPVAAYYPGLATVTAGVQALTGLPAFASAVVVLVLARVIVVLALLGLIRLVTGSHRAAAVGVLVYLTNPQLLFFNSQYSYQTLALPLALLCVYLVATRRDGGPRSLILPMIATAAVVFTHHLTAALLIAAYGLWLVLEAVRGRTAPSAGDSAIRRRTHRTRLLQLGVLTPWGLLLLVGSVLNPGNPLRTYLGAIVGSSAADLTSLSRGRQTKALFADSAGTGPAPWEQVLLIAAVLIATASMLIVLGYIRTQWRAARPLALLLGLVALLYPLIPGSHLTRATAEVGDRSAGFLFVGLAVVIGAWWWRRERSGRVRTVFAAAVAVVFLGNVVLGAGPAAGQLPGPYQISADPRSMDADNLAAAGWLAVGVPKDSVVYGDRTSGGLAAAYGHQRTVLHVSTDLDLSRLLLAPTFTADDRALIERSDLAYLIVDRRLSDGLPHQEFYIESGEFGGEDRTGPVSTGALAKFGSVPGVQRVYDNGSLTVYDVRGLR